ncbi:carboxyl transferase domain-containing protein, partial [Acinetobacter baumannii]
DNDAHAIALTRELVDKLNWDKVGDAVREPAPTIAAPLYAEEELLGCIPTDDREPFDTREVIARIVDGSDFLEFKANYGSETLCGHARID